MIGDSPRKGLASKGIFYGTGQPMNMTRPGLRAAATANPVATAFTSATNPGGEGFRMVPRDLVAPAAEADRAAANAASARAQGVNNVVATLRSSIAGARGAGDPVANQARDLKNMADMGDKFVLGRRPVTNNYAQVLGGVASLRMKDKADAVARDEAAASRKNALQMARAQADGVAAAATAKSDAVVKAAELRARGEADAAVAKANAEDPYISYRDDPVMYSLVGELGDSTNVSKEGKRPDGVRAQKDIMADMAERKARLDEVQGYTDDSLADGLAALQTMTPEQRAEAIKSPKISAMIREARRRRSKPQTATT